MRLKSAMANLRRLALAAVCAITPMWDGKDAKAWEQGAVETFAVLPEGSSGPEGLAVASDGTVCVTTFGYTNEGRSVLFDPPISW